MSKDATVSWIDTQREEMVRLLESWANINSESHNVPGLSRMLEALRAEFSTLGGEHQLVDLKPQESIGSAGNRVEHPLGRALSIRIRRSAPLRVFLNIHYDTVYPPEHFFQRAVRVDAGTLRGPGVLDAKGGIVVLLTAVREGSLSCLRLYAHSNGRHWRRSLGWKSF
jgi:glutamate carboxypeptidase